MIPRRRISLRLTDWAALWPSAAAAGDPIAAFERRFGETVLDDPALAVRAVASGRAALMRILAGLNLKAGDELIVPALTLGELIPLIQATGIVPVPADVDPDTFNLTPAAVRARLTTQTRAVLVLHVFGAPCDVAGVIASVGGIPVIEDCAHAPGARVGGRPVGDFGRAALFSLEATKAISAFGGGVLVTPDVGMAHYVDAAQQNLPRRTWPAVRRFLIKQAEELAVRSPLYGPLARWLFAESRAARFEARYRAAGSQMRGGGRGPAAFSPFQARLASARLDGLAARHVRLNALWTQLAAALPAGFTAQRRDACGSPVFYNFVARYGGDVSALRQAALARGLDLGIGGEVIDDVATLLGDPRCPNAARLQRELVLIPLYDGMTARDVDRVAARLAAAAATLPTPAAPLREPA